VLVVDTGGLNSKTEKKKLRLTISCALAMMPKVKIRFKNSAVTKIEHWQIKPELLGTTLGNSQFYFHFSLKPIVSFFYQTKRYYLKCSVWITEQFVTLEVNFSLGQDCRNPTLILM